MEQNKIILTVYFCGTASDIDHDITQIGFFYHRTLAEDITESKEKINPLNKDYKLGFSGCGITNGLLGTIFAAGLDGQCNIVIERLCCLLEIFGEPITLNCVGLSRGGMACLILFNKISQHKILSQNGKVIINALLFDPVPGNLITSSFFDWFGFTLTNQCLDVSKCVNLKKVLAIYPHKPLPDFSFHAPILPKYPPHCEVIEDVTLGCHQGAMLSPEYYSNFPSIISYKRIKDFLIDNGANIVKLDKLENMNIIDKMDEYVVSYPADIDPKTAIRYTHSWRSATIVCNKTGEYLNKYHKELKTKGKNVGGGTYILEII